MKESIGSPKIFTNAGDAIITARERRKKSAVKKVRR